jgi:hypothetical protein
MKKPFSSPGLRPKFDHTIVTLLIALMLCAFAAQAADTDTDGLDDAWEMLYFGDLDEIAGGDPDADNLNNAAEQAGGTNPANPDTDGDDIRDDVEASTPGLNPLSADSDSDNIPDGVEDADHNGLVAGDTNGDRILNNGETWTETDPTKSDSDADTIPDGVEDADHNGSIAGDSNTNRVLNSGETWTETNPLSADSDGDGIGDASEDANQDGAIAGDLGNDRANFAGENWTETDPANPDTDQDGISDGLESGEDSDGDGKVDALEWDSDNDLIPDSVEDANGDGLIAGDIGNDRTGSATEAWTETDPRNPDSDGDGINDGAEDLNDDGLIGGDTNGNRSHDPGEIWTETNPLSGDSDGDGIPDGIEDANNDGLIAGDVGNDRSGFPGEPWTETDPANPDTDGDGIPDGIEDADHNGLILGDSDVSGTLDPDEYWLETSPLASDSDGDTIPDGMEGRPLAGGGFDWNADLDGDNRLNPVDRDSDGDGRTDNLELADVSTVDTNTNFKQDPGETWTGTYAYQADSDGDGMPDGWEVLYGLNPLDPTDAIQDLDSGGLNNLNEFLKNRNPDDAADDTAPEPESTSAAYAEKLAGGDVTVTRLISGGESTSVFAGNFSGTATFDNISLIASGSRARNAFVGLRNHETNWEWLIQLSSTSSLSVTALAHYVDFVYVAGWFSGTLKSGLPGEVRSTISSTSADRAGFLLKLSRADGSIEGSLFTPASKNSIHSIAVNETGIALCGKYWDGALTINNAAGSPPGGAGSVATRAPLGGADMFIAKADLQFRVLWINSGGGQQDAGSDDAEAVAMNSAGDVYVTGKIHGSHRASYTNGTECFWENSCKHPSTTSLPGTFERGVGNFYSISSPYSQSYDKCNCAGSNGTYTMTEYLGTSGAFFLGKFDKTSGDLIAHVGEGMTEPIREDGAGLSILATDSDVFVGGRVGGKGFLKRFSTTLGDLKELLIISELTTPVNAVSKLAPVNDGSGGFLVGGKFNIPQAEFGPNGPVLSTLTSSHIFVGKAIYENSALSFDEDGWVRSTSENELLPPEQIEIAGMSYEIANGGRLTYAGYFTGNERKTLSFGSATNPAQLVHPGTSTTATSFVSQYDTTGGYVNVILLEIISAYGENQVRPGVGQLSFLTGERVIVEFPRYIYHDSTSVNPDLPIWDLEDAETQTELYDTRYTAIGYRLGDALRTEDGNRYDFVITQYTRIQIDWRTDFKLTITSEVVAPLDDGIQDESRATLGSPNPATGVHWIPKAQEVSPKVTGVSATNNINDDGIRYALESYLGTGSAPSSAATFSQQEGELQVGNRGGGSYFIMTTPSSLTYNWERQYKIEMRVSRDEAESHPIVHLPGAPAEDEIGTGVFWYRHGSQLQLGVRVGNSQLSAVGWLIATGHVDPVSLPNDIHNSLQELVEASTSDDWKEITVAGTDYYILDIASLTEATKVFWDFGDTIIYTNRALGDYLEHYYKRDGRNDAITIEPSVEVLQSPAGSALDDMQIWDLKQNRMYPLRPGAILITWEKADQSQTVKEWLQVGFPGSSIPDYSGNPAVGESFWIRDSLGQPTRASRHYAHVVGSNAVALDPSADDQVALLSDYFFFENAAKTSVIDNQSSQTTDPETTFDSPTESDGALDIAAATFTSGSPGKSVLLFSSSAPSTVPATGDLTTESLFVRIVESREWDGPNWLVNSELLLTNNEVSGANQLIEMETTAGLEPGDKVAIIDGANDEFDVVVSAVRAGSSKVTGVTVDLGDAHTIPGRLVVVLADVETAAAAGTDIELDVSDVSTLKVGDFVDLVDGSIGGGNTELGLEIEAIDAGNKTITIDLITAKSTNAKVAKRVAQMVYDESNGSDVLVEVLSGGSIQIGDTLGVVSSAAAEFGRVVTNVSTIPAFEATLASAKTASARVLPHITDATAATLNAADFTVTVTVDDASTFSPGDWIRFVDDLATHSAAIFPIYSVDAGSNQLVVGVLNVVSPAVQLYPKSSPVNVSTADFPASIASGARIYPVQRPLYHIAPASMEIGTKVTHNRFDTAGIESGCLLFGGEKGNYNADIHGDFSAWSATAPTPIIPVNRTFFADASLTATPSNAQEKGLMIVWHESKTEADVSLHWPYRPELFRQFHWPNIAPTAGVPTSSRRIVVASRLGSEGMDSAGNEQFSFHPDLYQDVRIYNQPNPAKPGYNPNEEHALIAPSFAHLNQPTPPAAAYALRNDLNVTTWGSTYSSDAYVLVQFILAGEGRMAVYKVELTDDTLRDPRAEQQLAPEVSPGTSTRTFRELSQGYTFDYWVKAGEPIVAPYPLNLVIDANSYNNSAAGTWSAPDGTIYRDKGSSRTWWVDHRGQGWVASGNEPGNFSQFSTVNAIEAKFYYPMRNDFWYPSEIAVGRSIPWMGTATLVEFPAVWPDDVPVLKAGETLTYAGGEFRADNPTYPGLPGVVGFQAAEIVFDSRNPRMIHANNAAANGWTARLISPLEERRVPLAELPTRFEPANGNVDVIGSEYRFKGLGPSLKRRIFYDPLTKELGIRGFVNDRTLGDSDLTASPPPVYILEPNILTAAELAELNDGSEVGLWINKLALETSAKTAWQDAVAALNELCLNPSELTAGAAGDFRVGLQPATTYDAGTSGREGQPLPGSVTTLTNGSLTYLESFLPADIAVTAEAAIESTGSYTYIDRNADPLPDPAKPSPLRGLGPGLAVVPNQSVLDPNQPFGVHNADQDWHESYVTIVENNDPSLGAAPITLHIIRVVKERRFRGAVKTILSDNVFDEKVVLRHSGDFGTNTGDLVYEWYIREEDGTERPLPGAASPDSWQRYQKSGIGAFQVSLEGVGPVILRDNLVFVRYAHKDEKGGAVITNSDWGGSQWDSYFTDRTYTVEGQTYSAQGEWAGAANSPDIDGKFRPQLVMGWVKRVLDGINPYEARISDFTNNESPATYVSMIRQAGVRYEGAVALNPDKDVIENHGLIELYTTVLNRAKALSIDLSQPVNTPGVVNAIQLAATRISDLYMLLGDEAWSDAMDPTIGLGSSSLEYGMLAPSIFTFQNQQPSLLHEELALLRGVDDTYGRPVYNRLFWNFTKSQGEAAYAMNYNIIDVNNDGFINESDALRQFPQGHGDAWGHYLTAIKKHYDLLRHPYFNWQSRSELYNLLDVVIKVDFLDERRFARAAAAKARTGAQIVTQTYRQKYVEDPDGQWQGYTDTDGLRAWGVEEWAVRAGQGALFDWYTANTLIPAEAPPGKEGIERVDRQTVTDIHEVSAQLLAVQSQYDNANDGLNPLGLHADAVPFDINPALLDRGWESAGTHFQQIYDRAFKALTNARIAFDYAQKQDNRLRQIETSTEKRLGGAIDQDLAFRNRLIQIFGSPYSGQVGAGKTYPAGYNGPDIRLYMYVDEVEIDTEAPEYADETLTYNIKNNISWLLTDKMPSGFNVDKELGTTEFAAIWDSNIPESDDITNQEVELPFHVRDYAFKADEDWGQRKSIGTLQLTLSEMMIAQAQVRANIKKYQIEIANLNENFNNLISLIKETRWKLDDVYALKISKEVLDKAKLAMDSFVAAKTISQDVVDHIWEFTTEVSPDAVAGTSNTIPVGAITRGSATATKTGWETSTKVAKFLAEHGHNWAIAVHDIAAAAVELEHLEYTLWGEIRASIRVLMTDVGDEKLEAVKVMIAAERTVKLGEKYRSQLQEGIRLLEERANWNKRLSGAVQKERYADMNIRVHHNEALRKYNSAFDLAARYAYLAAKAYEYETNLDENDPASAQGLLTQIVRERTLGAFQDGVQRGQPVIGIDGLADQLGRLKANYDALKSPMGINNPQGETGKISLRHELFRDKDDDSNWRNALTATVEPNLWDVWEFRQHCRPFQAYDPAVPQPGLVISFRTEIVAGNNLFGWPGGPWDHSYDPSSFATKIRSVGVEFPGYEVSQLMQTPRVYLIPVGQDIMTIPTSDTLQTRSWNIINQRIPVPFPMTDSDFAKPNWRPAIDSLNGSFTDIIRHSSFRAYHDDTGDYVDDSQMAYDSRLVGRSIWNTQWMLIIPGIHLLGYDPEEGTTRFINSVEDIKLIFKTYSHSGG